MLSDCVVNCVLWHVSGQRGIVWSGSWFWKLKVQLYPTAMYSLSTAFPNLMMISTSENSPPFAVCLYLFYSAFHISLA